MLGTVVHGKSTALPARGFALCDDVRNYKAVARFRQRKLLRGEVRLTARATRSMLSRLSSSTTRSRRAAQIPLVAGGPLPCPAKTEEPLSLPDNGSFKWAMTDSNNLRIPRGRRHFLNLVAQNPAQFRTGCLPT